MKKVLRKIQRVINPVDPFKEELRYWLNPPENRLEQFEETVHQKDVLILIQRIQNKFNIKGREIKVLDVGSGAYSRLTQKYEEGLIDLVAIDPLAEEYKNELGIDSHFLRKGYGETMNELWAQDSYHLVYASNSLDHTQKPQLVFQNMFNLTKSGGFLLICGNFNEGLRTNYFGLHQYNLRLDGENLFLSDKTKVSIPLNRSFPLRKVHSRIERRKSINWDWYLVVYEKEEAIN